MPEYPDPPNLRQLRAFEAVARLHSIKVASAEVGLSQPAVSQSIANLESTLATPLFERQHSGTYPNRFARILRQRVQRFFEELEAALSGTGRGGAASPVQIRSLQRRITAPQIRTLIAVTGAGTFSRAARVLGRSEASLQRSARELERTIGKQLFDRSSRGIVVNRTGAELARRFNVALREMEYALQDLHAAQGRIGGRVAIGSLPLARTLILPRTINLLLQAYPNAQVEVVEGPYDVLLDSLRSGRLDFLVGALRNLVATDDVTERILFFDPFAVVAKRGHPLVRKKSVTVDDLRKYDWVISRKGTPIRRLFDLLFADVEHPPRVSVETSSLVAARALLVESERITILSKRQIAIEQQLGMLQPLLCTLPEFNRAIGVTTRKKWMPSRLQREFYRMLRRYLRGSEPPLAMPMEAVEEAAE